MKNYLLLLFLSFSIGLMAQQKEGWVVGQDGDFLLGATVVFLQDGQFVSGTASDSKGRFTFDESQWDEIQVSYMGYEETLIKKEDVLEDNLLILPTAKYNLQEVVVVAGQIQIKECTIRCGCCRWLSSTNQKISNINQLEKIEELLIWKIFPNPTTDFVQIELKETISGQVEIFDMNGRLVSKTLALDWPLTVDVSHLPTGTYTIRLKNESIIQDLGKVVKIQD